MLITLSRHTAIYQSVAEISLTGVGAVSHWFILMTAAWSPLSYGVRVGGWNSDYRIWHWFNPGWGAGVAVIPNMNNRNLHADLISPLLIIPVFWHMRCGRKVMKKLIYIFLKLIYLVISILSPFKVIPLRYTCAGIFSNLWSTSEAHFSVQLSAPTEILF